MGLYGIAMSLYGVSMGLYESQWVCMCPYGSLWVSMGRYEISMGRSGSL